MKNDALMVGAFVALVIFLVLAVPIAQIWAVNTLFGTHVRYSFINFLAVIVLNSTLKAVHYSLKK